MFPRNFTRFYKKKKDEERGLGRTESFAIQQIAMRTLHCERPESL